MSGKLLDLLKSIAFWGSDASPEPEFTGICMVFEHAGDGAYVGRCYRSTYDYVCPAHGNVMSCLLDHSGWVNDWECKRP
jgi:hypothetical protein